MTKRMGNNNGHDLACKSCGLEPGDSDFINYTCLSLFNEKIGCDGLYRINKQLDMFVEGVLSMCDKENVRDLNTSANRIADVIEKSVATLKIVEKGLKND